MRYSKQRSLIMDVLKSTHTHPTAQWVYEQAKREMPSIGIATVYRNLNALVQNGDVQKIIAPGNIEHYDADTSDHWHMECMQCGRIVDLKASSEQLAALHRMIVETFDIRDENVRIGKTLLQGVCNDCLLRNKKGSDNENVH
ncbi:MAG: transcriptional repressor [Clostridiales bacterium]|nr:transcriptional repressor [Clostridiales bacterium]